MKLDNVFKGKKDEINLSVKPSIKGESFKENKKRDDLKLKKCLTNGIKMIYVIDNEKYLEKEYHFDNDMVNNYIKLYGELV